MTDIVLHANATSAIDTLSRATPHALLLTGPIGVGLLTTACYIADVVSDGAKGAVMTITPDDKGTISISTIKDLYVITRKKHIDERQIIIVDDGDAMSRDAQNALLKLLEEPPTGVIFVITSHAQSELLPTIRSRVSVVDIPPITSQQTMDFIRSGHVAFAAADQAKALFIANGLPAELWRLSHDERYRDGVFGAAMQAKAYIGGTLFERLSVAEAYAADRRQAESFIRVVLMMIYSRFGTDQSNAAVAHASACLNALEAIKQNGHIRTHMMNMAVQW